MKTLAIVAGLCVLLGPGRSAFAWQAADYAVGGQDVVTVTVFDHPNLSGKFTIEADGAFTFPLIGRVKAGGLTPRAIEEEISTRLRAGTSRTRRSASRSISIAVNASSSSAPSPSRDLCPVRQYDVDRGPLARGLHDQRSRGRGHDRAGPSGPRRGRSGAA